ncbi:MULTISPECIES: glycosyltransferase family 4 protein [Burkholderia]|uniref:Glycosyl transferase, group 1 family protein, putative n=1 Tax=Burkholderia gladioli (strain BSR3) TaxID=999541 RepID=F2LAK5_BURGS|nr:MULTISPECIES: glycosyltransferase family 1 protein [Burkholderia]AEA59392.1 Glycosyl transferase, group 1 family protein, putative [Burkholderia gladioli BSR3]MBW5282523.1 glycosyltransferase family 4 protein [Burkholderia gladioli]MDN7497466.1 glycosyltransferase family 1 protein [Burkholderia gladioli]NBI47432.1 glycosyltransferase family 1 protein [Burkholderia sp. ISTR5]
MKVAFAVDAIIPPLTGIGRYALELARHLAADDDSVESLQFFFVDERIENWSAIFAGDASNGRRRRRGLRRLLYRDRRIRRWLMQGRTRGYLFHSPNYLLPEAVEQGIVTVHDLSVFRFPETHPVERVKQFERRFAATLRRASHLITDSEAIRHEVAAYFSWPLERITAVPLGVQGEFRPGSSNEIADGLRQLGLTPGAYTLSVSTLEPRKRIDRLIRAYGELPADLRHRYPLVLAGGAGWLSDSLHRQIAHAQAEGWLRYLGFVADAQLPTLYQGAHAFFMPSKYEGFGLPVLEAMACGIPVLTSNVSSLPEVAGDAAWLVEPDDHDALREGLELVLTDATWREEASRRGLAIAARATWDRCAARTIDVYRAVAASR